MIQTTVIGMDVIHCDPNSNDNQEEWLYIIYLRTLLEISMNLGDWRDWLLSHFEKLRALKTRKILYMIVCFEPIEKGWTIAIGILIEVLG